jgi:CelD/BcsL family acetyltransferase involved in cellulose biosynthesis
MARLSLGTVLTAHAMRHSIENDGGREFDFLRGNEGYKYRWGALDRYNARLSLTRFGVRPLLLSGGGRVSLTMEQHLKTWMHRRHGGAGKGAVKDG